jgi:hypothetical protein
LNFLQLVQRTVVEGGASGSGVSPSTTAAQSGEYGRFVNWVNSAWLDVQAMHQDWDWLRTSASFPTVTGQANYTMAQISNISGVLGLVDFGMWSQDTFRNYVTAQGVTSEVFMDPISYDDWRNSYFYGALRLTQSRPLQIAVAPDKSICLGPVPLVGYTVAADYFKAPSVLVNDGDIPALPAQFHMAIVYRAMQFYGKYEKDDGVIAINTMEFNKIMRQLAADRLPQMTFGATLA